MAKFFVLLFQGHLGQLNWAPAIRCLIEVFGKFLFRKEILNKILRTLWSKKHMWWYKPTNSHVRRQKIFYDKKKYFKETKMSIILV